MNTRDFNTGSSTRDSDAAARELYLRASEPYLAMRKAADQERLIRLACEAQSLAGDRPGLRQRLFVALGNGLIRIFSTL